MAPFFSIIVPTKDCFPTVQATIQSIEMQTFRELEVIALDSYSVDGTRELLLSWAESSSLSVQAHTVPRRGVYAAMNEGIRRATGEYLLFVGGDDKLANGRVLEQTRRAIANQSSNPAILIGNIRYSDGTRHESIWGWQLLLRNTAHHQGTFYSASVFDDRQYDEKLKILSDYKLNLELYRSRSNVAVASLTISICGNDGLSKQLVWRRMYEEWKIKYQILGLRFFPWIFPVFLKQLAKLVDARVGTRLN